MKKVDLREFYNITYFEQGVSLGKSNYEGYTFHGLLNVIDTQTMGLYPYFKPTRVLDCGCAKGFNVYLYRSVFIEAYGCDISDYAIRACPSAIRDWLTQVTLGKEILPYSNNRYDLVTSFEVLEHIPEEDIQFTLQEIKRVASKWVVMSIHLGERKDETIEHCTLRSRDWWNNQITQSGLILDNEKLEELQHNPFISNKNWELFVAKKR